MRPRFRLLVALLALFAFGASTAEALWASTCEMPGAAAVQQREGMPDAPCAATPMQAVDSGGQHRGDSRPDAPHCPLTAVGGAGCVALFAWGGEVRVALPSLAETVLLPSAPPAVRDRLAAMALFRPPRA